MADERRKKTEELLAGFDRPARTPRAGSVRRNFVDHHAGREREKAPPPPAKREHDLTFVIERERPSRGWLVWIALIIGMPAAGGVVAWAFLAKTPPPVATPLPASASAATTITAAGAPPLEPTPRPAESAPPPPSAPRPRPSASARGDFVRSL